MNALLFKRLGALTGPGAMIVLTLLAAPAPAQPPPGRPPPMIAPPPFAGPRPLTPARVPLSALTAGLGLSGDQQDKIARLRQQARPKFPPGLAPPPASDLPMTRGLLAVLTGPQKQALPGLLQTLRALRLAGVPLLLYADLKLTPVQRRQIAALAPSDPGHVSETARRPARAKVMALLTTTQKELVEEARFAGGGPPPFPPGGRPRRRGGPGPDWRGGPPPGGPDGRMGGPPPDGPGGPGGPPPDGF